MRMPAKQSGNHNRTKHGPDARVTRKPPSRPPQSHSLRALTEQIQTEESDLRQGGGEAGRQRQIKLGRLPVRQRLELLLDRETPFIEIGLWAAYGMYGEVGGAVAAGVITGVGYVHERPVMVIANDATVKAGAFFPAT